MYVKFSLGLCTEDSVVFINSLFTYSVLCAKKKKKKKHMHLGKHSLNTVFKIIKVSNTHYLINFVKYKVKEIHTYLCIKKKKNFSDVSLKQAAFSSNIFCISPSERNSAVRASQALG